jgi:hypothetical protein
MSYSSRAEQERVRAFEKALDDEFRAIPRFK